ncbi:hypothetical protein LMG26841_05179 [Achromobacter dolens]|uniref:DUF1364 domain-containing protein n=1 Tax=Achromobacter dolens TaxID=1287738 RepID=A0A6S7ETF8_9BURK|nr:hypothetical protein [Achromobacter dolens]CAB3914570.1 hypothetical protein LMG26841_05179 [Achromobacter dolens]
MLKRSAPLTRKTPLRATGARLSSGSSATLARQSTLQRAAIKRRAPKKRPGHAPKYTAAIKGECCYLRFPGCRSYEKDPTVVPAHQNEGKDMGLKVHDKFTVPACHFCHALYDQSGIDREIKRATFDWAYTRWEPVRASKLQEAA